MPNKSPAAIHGQPGKRGRETQSIRTVQPIHRTQGLGSPLSFTLYLHVYQYKAKRKLLQTLGLGLGHSPNCAPAELPGLPFFHNLFGNRAATRQMLLLFWNRHFGKLFILTYFLPLLGMEMSYLYPGIFLYGCNCTSKNRCCGFLFVQCS